MLKFFQMDEGKKREQKLITFIDVLSERKKETEE